MLGQVVKFVDHLQQGVIVAEDGERFRFSCAQLYNPHQLAVGVEVDFLVESRRPHGIVALSGSAWSAFGECN